MEGIFFSTVFSVGNMSRRNKGKYASFQLNPWKRGNISKNYLHEIIGKYYSKPLTEFDDVLFEAMVEKVIIKSTTEFEIVLKVGKG